MSAFGLEEKYGRGYNGPKVLEALWAKEWPEKTKVCACCENYFIGDGEEDKEFPMCEACREATEQELDAASALYDDEDDPRNKEHNEDDPRREHDFENHRINQQTVEHITYQMNCRGM